MQTDCLKNEEIYNVFDTGKFLNRPPLCCCVQYFRSCRYRTLDKYILSTLKDEKQVDKNSELVVVELKKWVDEEYEAGRVTVLTDRSSELNRGEIERICE